MSLYFEERIDEQKKEDSENDKITFIFPWVIEIPPRDENGERPLNGWIFLHQMVTTYNFLFLYWRLRFTNDRLTLNSTNHSILNAICNISYTLFYDNDMRFELYSSPKVSAISTLNNSFKTPDGFLAKFQDEYGKEKIARTVVFIEFVLHSKHFFRPFNLSSPYWSNEFCNKYPEDMENDFKFEFLKDCDYSIKCSDGSIPALRMVLNVSSKFMRKHLKQSKDDELVVEHSIDVVKPIVYYLHSRCLQMAKSYDLSLADRMFKAIDFFDLDRTEDLIDPIELSLCQKFVEERFNFNEILRWLQISIQHELRFLAKMVNAIIANKFYFEWEQTFPRNARVPENPLFRDIFGSDGHNFLEDRRSVIYRTFIGIESTYLYSIFTNAILN